MTTKPPSRQELSEAFMELVKLTRVLGVKNIKELPGCWEHQIDVQWWVAVNGHDAATKCSKGVEIGAYQAYVEFNGWPAGSFSPLGGVIAAGGAANEKTFIAAVRAAAAAWRERQAQRRTT